MKSELSFQNSSGESIQKSKSLKDEVAEIKKYIEDSIDAQKDSNTITPESVKQVIEKLTQYNKESRINDIRNICGYGCLRIHSLFSIQDGKKVIKNDNYLIILKSKIKSIDECHDTVIIMDIILNGLSSIYFDNPELEKALIERAEQIAKQIVQNKDLSINQGITNPQGFTH